MKSMDFAKFEILDQILVKCVSCYKRTPTPRNRAAKNVGPPGQKGPNGERGGSMSRPAVPPGQRETGKNKDKECNAIV